MCNQKPLSHAGQVRNLFSTASCHSSQNLVVTFKQCKLGRCHTTGNFHEPMALIVLATLPLTTQAASWEEAWWRCVEFWQAELPRDLHWKSMESGLGHALAHRDCRLPPLTSFHPPMFGSPLAYATKWKTLTRCFLSCYVCSSCGGSNEIGVTWLHRAYMFS